MTRETAAAILNVASDATPVEVKAAYRSRARMWHPDRFVHGTDKDRADAAAEFIRITEAYEFLTAHPAQPIRASPSKQPSTSAGATRQQPAPPHGESRANPSSAHAPEGGLREYLGFGPRPAKSAAQRFREYLGFGDGRR